MIVDWRAFGEGMKAAGAFLSALLERSKKENR